MECVSHTGYLTHGNSKGEAIGICRHKDNSKRVIRNIEERNVGTSIKYPKQGLIASDDLTIILTKGRDSSYHRSN